MEICREKERFWIRSDVERKEGYEREEMRRERKVMERRELIDRTTRSPSLLMVLGILWSIQEKVSKKF